MKVKKQWQQWTTYRTQDGSIAVIVARGTEMDVKTRKPKTVLFGYVRCNNIGDRKPPIITLTTVWNAEGDNPDYPEWNLKELVSQVS